MSRLALYLLGVPRMELSGEPVHLGRKKALAFLAYLAVERRTHSRDALAATFWPEHDQRRARANLRDVLSTLNRHLGPEWFVADRERIAISIDAEIWLDVDQFSLSLAACETHGHPLSNVCPACLPLLEEALGLYKGDFVAGFTLPDSLEFDDWQRLQSEALRQALALALERMVRGLSAQETYGDALPYARRWLELDPTHEPPHRHLMALYARTGHTSAALQQYSFCESTLAEELGVPPSEETRALYERIRAGEVEIEQPALMPEREIPRERPDLFRHNLPPQRTCFVGREEELADLDRLITDPEARLITIVGPGGMGKTRLALAAAEGQVNQTTAGFPDGVCFVPLAAHRSSDDIVSALVEALSFGFQGGDKRTPKQQVLDHLRVRRMLLVLDNMEHLLGQGAAVLVADLLHAASDIQILATSRERLYLQEEQVYPIQGLAFADWETSEDAATYTAAQLFLQSARRVQPDFELDADDAATHTDAATLTDVSVLAQICRLVEGMPLALELAASWVDVLPLANIVAEVQSGLDFLETEWRDVPERHRSMRAVIDGSWRQLSPAEQKVFAQLSVFRGGFTRGAARAVVRAETGVPVPLRSLARLVNRSLVQYDKSRDRYNVHELLRQYAVEKLAQHPAHEAEVRDRYCTYFCTALERWEAELNGPRQTAALNEIEADLENARVALKRAAVGRDVARLDQALTGLSKYYWRRTRHHDNLASCQLAIEMLAQVDASASEYADAQLVTVRAMIQQVQLYLVLGLGTLAQALFARIEEILNAPALLGVDTRAEEADFFYQMGQASEHDPKTARPWFEQSLSLRRSLGDRANEAWSLSYLGITCIAQGDLDSARQIYQESLTIHRSLGNLVGIVFNLNLLGQVASHLDEHQEAQRLLVESVTLARVPGGQPLEAWSLAELGRVLTAGGDYDAARRRFVQSLALAQAAGLGPVACNALIGFGELAMKVYDADEAKRRFEEALALCEAHSFQAGIAAALAPLGRLALFQGRFKDGVDYARQSVALIRETGHGLGGAFELVNLGAAHWLCGAFAEAEGAIEEALALAEGTESQIELAFLSLYQAQADSYAGRYEQACAQAGTALAQLRAAEDRWVMGPRPFWTLYSPAYSLPIGGKTDVIGQAHGIAGWAALGEDDYGTARRSLQESIAALREIGDREQEARALAGLCRAAHGLGKPEEAQGYLLETLEIVVEIGAFVPLMHLMPIVAVLLADSEEPNLQERAVELYALATCQPLVAKGQLFQDVAGRHITAATATLPPQAVEAAQRRGRALDWWETASVLLEELRTLGWARLG